MRLVCSFVLNGQELAEYDPKAYGAVKFMLSISRGSVISICAHICENLLKVGNQFETHNFSELLRSGFLELGKSSSHI